MEMTINRALSRHAVFLAVITIFAASCSVWAVDNLLILRSEGKAFDEAVQGLSSDLGESFQISQMKVSKESTAAQVLDRMNQTSPNIVVLMDNTAINIYHEYQRTRSDSLCIPSVSLMAVSIDVAIRGMCNATGIQYEIPIVTSVVNLRGVLGFPINRVGVMYRKGKFGDFVERSREYCSSENIEIIDRIAPEDGSGMELFVREALKDLVRNQKVQAIWVPLDIALLRPEVLRKSWVPLVKELKIPLVVGSENLVNPVFGFFGVLPDHVALGAQAADKIYEIRENSWQVVGSGTSDPPLSVYKVVSAELAKTMFKVKDENLQGIDKLAK